MLFEQAPKMNKTKRIIIILIGVIVLGFGIVYFPDYEYIEIYEHVIDIVGCSLLFG